MGERLSVIRPESRSPIGRLSETCRVPLYFEGYSCSGEALLGITVLVYLGTTVPACSDAPATLRPGQSAKASPGTDHSFGRPPRDRRREFAKASRERASEERRLEVGRQRSRSVRAPPARSPRALRPFRRRGRVPGPAVVDTLMCSRADLPTPRPASVCVTSATFGGAGGKPRERERERHPIASPETYDDSG